MLTQEQTEEIKNQIMQQIESTFPEDKKDMAKSKISGMNSEQLEEFLKQNKMIKEQQGQECIFCSIVFGDIPSHKIGENDKAIAILEINPISKGHTLIIPKEHISSKEKLPKEVLSLAQNITSKIKTKLGSKDVNIFSSNLFGHEILNLLPIYDKETPDSPRKQAKPEELAELQKILEKEEEIPPKKPKRAKKEKSEEKIRLPKRIP
jgi:histidine triad (HIT) family protein